MPAWNSSSLTFSEGGHNHGMSRHNSSSLLKNTKERMSKQSITSNRMFGSRMGKHGKDFKIGKLFKKKGKGIIKSMKGIDHKGIGPSVEEFDDMLNSAGGKNKKKSMFSRKSFG